MKRSGLLKAIFDPRTVYGSQALTAQIGVLSVPVTINQGASQPDPTGELSIVFDVVFAEAMTGFATGDVDLSASTVGGSLVGTVVNSGDDINYTVTVTGMTSDGDVIATIPAGVATSIGSGAINSASTSTDNTVEWVLAPVTGGTEIEAGDGYHYHLWANGSSTLTHVADVTVAVRLTGGGGSGGNGGATLSTRGGGGGAGEYVEDDAYPVTGNVSLDCGLQGAAQATTMTDGNDGSDSTFGTLTARGGGGGAGQANGAGLNGGCGGGGAGSSSGANGAGGTSTAVPPGVGFAGANGTSSGTNSARRGGGGGGAGVAGGTGGQQNGGDGVQTNWEIVGYPDGWVAGGGGGMVQTVDSVPGLGGGGKGGDGASSAAAAGIQGTGGGGGGVNTGSSARGAYGLMAVRYTSRYPLPPKFSATSRTQGITGITSGVAVSLPAGSTSGDLIFGVATVLQNIGLSNITYSTGWSGTQHQSATITTRLIARILDGSGDDSLTVTSGGGSIYHIWVVRIAAADHGLSSVASIAASAATIGTGANSTPPSLTPGSGSDFLWIVSGHILNTGLSFNAGPFSSAPTGFGKAFNILESNGQIRSVVGMRRDGASSITPGAWSHSANANGGVHWTIGIPRTP